MELPLRGLVSVEYGAVRILVLSIYWDSLIEWD
jgi:hypothetical protein